MNIKGQKNSEVQVVNDDETLACYERAQQFHKGMFGKDVARNTTLFPVWITNSNSFWYERELKVGKEFRLVDSNNGTNKTAFNHQVLAKALAEVTGEKVDANNLPINIPNGMPEYIMKITLDPIVVNFLAFERRWEFNNDSQSLIEVERIPNNWVVSPDRSQAAFRRDYNIWVRNLETGEERSLTTDGEEFYQYGIPGSIWGNDAYMTALALQAQWSPDGKRLFTLQNDQRQVKTVGEIQHVPLDGSLRPTTRQRKLAFPEDTDVEMYRLLVIDVETANSKEADYEKISTTMGARGGFFFNSLGWWSADSRRAYFVDVDRYYKYARVVEFDTYTGATKMLFEETSITRLDLLMHPLGYVRILPLLATEELLWCSERSGWAHCYLYDLETGKLKTTVTSGEWVVREIIHFDKKRRELFLSTSGRAADRDPYYCDLVRVNIDTGELITVVASDHEYAIQSPIGYAQSFKGYAGLSSGVSPSGDYAVVTRSRVDEIAESYLLDRTGKKILDLEIADYSLPKGWHWPEPVKMKAKDGQTDIYGVIYRPSNFSSDRSYPVIDQSYIGHIASAVARSSFRTGVEASYAEAASLAELGFIVVQIDGRGGLFRSKAFQNESYAWKDIGCNVDDHVVGIQQLAERYPYMDLDRVGIFGSFGGTGALRGLLHHPDFFKVGVAGQILDFRVMGANMGDMYEGPSSNPKKKHLEDLVENLTGKLLITVGLLDYVPPAASLRIVEALQRANKDFDLIVEPCGGYYVTSYQLRRAWDYLVCHLQGNQPPKCFRLGPLSSPIIPKEFGKNFGEKFKT